MTITDVAGVRVGHWSDQEAMTGCTVVLFQPEGAVAGVDIRGSAPGTRETDLLRPGRLVERIHALALCGGSAFGLAAVEGVMRFLRERKVGVDTGPALVPIVPAAVIFDLNSGRPEAFPGAEAGYAACLDAERGEPLRCGRVGAATGATVGKLFGFEHSQPGGCGSAALTIPGGAKVGALAVVNALGDIVEGERIIAGARADGRFLDSWRTMLSGERLPRPFPASNTTLGVIATDARLDKAQCQKLAEVGHDGLALAIRPVHTMFDGDTVFAVSTGDKTADLNLLSAAAVDVMARAIRGAAGAVGADG
ncbi:MAG: P1 family peptidase [Candidatus Dormibacteraeota bacterium]|nr:P1 family peptidase [Candidatus Dormibacteraeota bacterium]